MQQTKTFFILQFEDWRYPSFVAPSRYDGNESTREIDEAIHFETEDGADSYSADMRGLSHTIAVNATFDIPGLE